MKKTAFCFDLDGTITEQELLPLIAKEAGIYEEINLLTQITLKGLIPFQNSFKLRVKLLSTIPISIVTNIVNQVRLDKNIAQFIRENKEHCYVVTGNLDVWINEIIGEKLGCNYFSSKANFNNDTLLGINSILNKYDAVKQLKEEYHQVIAIGDSMNDCSMFQLADIGIAYGGIHEPVESLKKISQYIVYDSRPLVNILNHIRTKTSSYQYQL